MYEVPTMYAPVTPSDTVPVNAQKGLHVSGAGNVAVKGVDGVSAIFAVLANTRLEGKFTYVLATGTTATGIVALS